MNNYKRNFYFLLVIAFFAAVTLGWYAIHQYQIIETKTEQVAALTDTVKLYRTKSGASGAERKVFTGTKADVLAVLKNTDKTAYNYVKNTSGIQSYTDFSTHTRIDTVVKADSVYLTKDSNGKADYVLEKDIEEPKGFYDAHINVHNDSVGLKLQLTDKYHVMTEEKSNGFLKGKSLVVTVENENPYVVISGAKSFNISQQNKHTGIKIGGVAIIGIGAFLLLHK